ncbi:MAG: pyridoxamine 5'-phosphate oxidase [Bacteroidetes bacterium]|nr:MAG: pyridoxamine 5'-phosphate oxidase [Bacteroidota bacterium]
MVGSLSEAQIDNLLISQNVGRIACCSKGKPYIVPITYSFDGEHIYGQTREGMKLDILRENPVVCFEVDTMTDMFNWQSVVIWGKFEELEGGIAIRARDYLFERVMTLMTSIHVHPHEHEAAESPDDSNRVKPVMYRIKIEEKTGRFEKR